MKLIYPIAINDKHVYTIIDIINWVNIIVLGTKKHRYPMVITLSFCHRLSFRRSLNGFSITDFTISDACASRSGSPGSVARGCF